MNADERYQEALQRAHELREQMIAAEIEAHGLWSATSMAREAAERGPQVRSCTKDGCREEITEGNRHNYCDRHLCIGLMKDGSRCIRVGLRGGPLCGLHKNRAKDVMVLPTARGESTALGGFR